MYVVRLTREDDLESFRTAARGLLANAIAPELVAWRVGEAEELFGLPSPQDGTRTLVRRGFVPLLEDVICHSEPERFAVLYTALWRLTHGEPKLLEIVSDPLVHALLRMQKAVRRDMHKMTAFVRFRQVATDAGEHFVAWFEPEHHILRRIAPFFADRFAGMQWSIATPRGAIHWDGEAVHFDDDSRSVTPPPVDDAEQWWQSYYRATFNPARLNLRAMRAEMPQKYWRNLPEASLIPQLAEEAGKRAAQMIAAPATVPRKRIPALAVEEQASGGETTLAGLAALARSCERCPLFSDATQTVFGEGPATAPVVFVGEQPGDQEDLAGRPFVGPAGQLFDQALAEAGIDRAQVYVTNAVKHFKYVPRGKRRIHQKPNVVEIEQCRWWLDKELALVEPRLTVALGASAARSLTGRPVGIERERGTITQFRGRPGLVTVHPSYLLRLPDEGARAREYARFVSELIIVAAHVPAIRRAA